MHFSGEQPVPETSSATIGERLSRLSDHVTKTYERLASLETPDDMKAIVTHQAACLAVLSHLEMLLKLRRGLEGRRENQGRDEGDRVVQQLLDEAGPAIAVIEADVSR